MLNQKKPKARKDYIKQLARAHYFISFSIILVLVLIVLIIIGFNITSLFITASGLIICIPLCLLLIKTFTEASANLIAIASVKIRDKRVIESDVRVTCASGAPGSGKTSSQIYDTVIRSNYAYQQLTYLYWLYSSKNEDKLTKKQIEEKKEVVEAYEYYEKKGTIPCLWSRTDIYIDGKKSNKLSKKHEFQLKKLPYLSVIFHDEIGNDFEASRSLNKQLKPLSQLARFIRHFFNGYMFYTEQDFSKTFIDVRRVTGSIKYYIKQVWVLKPLILCNIYNYLQKHFTRFLRKSELYLLNSKKYNILRNHSLKLSKKYSIFLIKFKHYINCIGFRRYTYRELGNPDTSVDYEGNNCNNIKIKSYLVPSCLNASYDDTCFRNVYACKDKNIYESVED